MGEQISFASEFKHGEQLAKALAYLAEALPEEDGPRSAPLPRANWVDHGPCLEPVIDYHITEEDNQLEWVYKLTQYSVKHEQEFVNPAEADPGCNESPEWMYRTVIKDPKIPAEDCDINPYQIAWLVGRNAARLVMLVDDFMALVPDYGFISTKRFTVRYAKHSISRSPHVQATLAEAYNQFYSVKPCDWEYDPEYLESEYDPELSSRYYTDIDPANEKNHDHDHAVDWVAVAAADDYIGGIVGQLPQPNRFDKIAVELEQEDDQPLEQKLTMLESYIEPINHMREAYYTNKDESKPLLRKGIKAQSRGQRFKKYATEAQAAEYRRKFRQAA